MNGANVPGTEGGCGTGGQADGNDALWMRRALGLAARAESEGEVPVGALILAGGEVVAEGWNRPIRDRDPSAHAEIVALRAAARHFDNYRLPGTTVYVTLEPCVMCAGALLHARVARVVYGAADPRAGAAGSVFDVLRTRRLNHRIEVRGGVLETDCGRLLQAFFERRRTEPAA
jgi:tRNA(adenine34) deaminase